MLKNHLLIAHAILCVVMACTVTQAAQPQVLESAQWLPDSCTAMISVTSMEDLQRNLKKTPLYALLQDPAMKPVIAPIKAKLQENIKEELSDFWQELEISRPPQSLPRPQGRVVFGAEVKEREFEYFYPADDENEAETVRENDMDWQFILVAEMGKHTEETATLFKQLTEAARDGDMIHRHRQVGPTELHWFLEDADDDPEYDTPCYALQGQHLVLSTSTRLAEETLKNLKRPGRSLAQSKILQSMARQVHDGDVTLVVEADPIRKVLMNLVPDKNKYQAQRALDVLGVQQLQGILASFQFRLQGQEVLNMQTLLATDGPPQGIFALLCPEGDDLNLKSLTLQPGAAAFGQTHLNPSELYEKVVDMVRQIQGVDLNFFVQTALSTTGGQQAPLDLKRDLLDHMAPPITTRTLFKRPLSQWDPARDVITIALRNDNAVDTALARLHQTYLSDMGPDLQREMLGHTLYLLPAMELDVKVDGDNMADTSADIHYTLAVINSELVIGQLDDLEQLIRDTRKDHRENLTQDPMFKQVRRQLPSQAGQFSYTNLRLCAEFGWEWLRQGLGEALKEKKEMSPEDVNSYDLSPGEDFLRELSDLIQPSDLPPFSAIAKYFGAVTSYGKRTEHGIFSETLYLRAPASLD